MIRYGTHSRAAAAITVAVCLGSATAGDKNATPPGTEVPCEKDKKFLGHPKDKAPKPTCDSKIYPLSDAKYIKQFCGPQVCPNACFGYFPNTWRTWDAACGIPQNVPTVAVPAAVPPAPVPTKPMPVPMTPPGKADRPQTANPGTVEGIAIEPPKTADPGKSNEKKGETANPTQQVVPSKPNAPKRDQSPITIPIPADNGLIVAPAPPGDVPGILLFGTVPSSTSTDPKR